MVKKKGISMVICTLLVLSLLFSFQTGSVSATATQAVSALNPHLIPKFVNQLVIPPVYSPMVTKDPATGKVISHDYTVDASEFEEQILPAPLPQTLVWGYGGMVKDPGTGKQVYFRNAPGATFEAVKGIPVNVKWINKITGPQRYAVDPTLHWANPNMMSMEPPKPWPAFPTGFPMAQSSVPLVPHLHGGETQSIYDGHPEAWFTADGKKGPTYTTSEYKYLNTQPPATLWYHDHALGMTRINVYSGLAGFYLLRDPKDKLEKTSAHNTVPVLPVGKYDIPLVIQDRSFNSDGTFQYDNIGINPEIHPYWTPEFFGDSIVVNGKAWPNFNVERKQYRFRVLNGSNARFYNLSLSNNMKFTQITSDGGYLPAPVKMKVLLLAPGERADILIDFSKLAAGSSIILKNDANAPYPGGDKVDTATTGQIMRFTISKTGKPVVPRVLPKVLNHIPKLTPNRPERILTLNEVMGPEGPEEILLNGQKWMAPITEAPKVGSTEDWVIVNMTEDTHPIHLHLVQFQLISRQSYRGEEYKKEWTSINGSPPVMKPVKPLSVSKYLIGKPSAPDPNEAGWKDTVRMNPEQITRIRVRFAPQDTSPVKAIPGVNLFPFNPTIGPGYVWHCHILDHEDNEMMRPFIIKP